MKGILRYHSFIGQSHRNLPLFPAPGCHLELVFYFSDPLLMDDFQLVSIGQYLALGLVVLGAQRGVLRNGSCRSSEPQYQ